MLKQFLVFLEPHIVDGSKIMLRLFLYVALVIFLVYAALAISFYYPLDYGEAPLVDQARRLAAGLNIYRPDLSTPPYTIANYPPLYILSLVPFVNLSGMPFLAGRAISVLSALAAAIFLGLISHTFSKDRFAALATGLLFLAIPYVVSWSGLLRIDLLALALSLAGLYVLIRWPGATWGLAGGGLLLVAAAYTRQSYALAAPLAALAWLWTYERRRALALALLVGGLGLILFVGLNILTNGGFFVHIVAANVNEFGWERLAERFGDLSITAPLLLILGGAFLVFGRGRARSWPLLAFYLIGATLSALTIGKIGSNVNYFLELSAALSLVAGAFIAWSRPHPWQQAALLILLALQTGLLMRTTLDESVDGWLTARRSETEALRELEGLVAEANDPILADEDMGLLTLHRRPLYLQPFEMTQLARTGRWNQADLLADIDNHAFSLILIHHFPFSSIYQERWTAEMLSAIGQNYTPILVMAGTAVYQPQRGPTVASLPDPVRAASFKPDRLEVGPWRRISQVTYALQPNIAISPTDPDHLAAIVATTSDFECDTPDCQLNLLLYVSTDGGATWKEQFPFTGERQSVFAGTVDFGPEGALYVLGIRNGALTVNWASPEAGYEMAVANQKEVTRGQVAARPWLRVDPRTGDLFISYASQFRDRFILAPSLIRSSNAGEDWSRTIGVNQSVAMADIARGRANWPEDIQVLLAEGDQLALAWTWDPEPWHWPRGVWLATSADGGESFSQPTQIAETWGPISTATRNGNYYILYRSGTERTQGLAIAISTDGGQSWTASLVSGDVPLTFEVDKGPSLDVAPNGTIDVLFYARGAGATDCAFDLAGWQQTLGRGWIDTCVYNVYYTFSRDGGRTFSEPLQLNETPIRGERFVRLGGRAIADASRGGLSGSHLGMASTDEYAYPIWIDTQGVEGTQAFTVRIAR
jgi:hypothetical protein